MEVVLQSFQWEMQILKIINPQARNQNFLKRFRPIGVGKNSLSNKTPTPQVFSAGLGPIKFGIF